MPTIEREQQSLNKESSSVSAKVDEVCTASEEYSAVPEIFYSLPVDGTTNETGGFYKRKYEIFERLKAAIEACSKRFSSRKELASEYDDYVVELCESLEEALQYGLRTQQLTQLNFVVSAAFLFQNMQEIVTGSSSDKSKSNYASTSEMSFWDFCQNFLTPHEKERFEKLKHVNTKLGKGRAFIRASLNEHSLQRYLLTWLSEEEILMSHYSHWSILMDVKMAKSLNDLIKTLDQVLFALTVDKVELNTINPTNVQQPIFKDEPVIFAPTPIKVEQKTKKKAGVERPIASTNSTDDLLKQIENNTKPESTNLTFEEVCTSIAEQIAYNDTPPDPIEPELAFLKEPLVCSPTHKDDEFSENGITSLSISYHDADGDSSSQSSKFSNNNLASQNLCNNSDHHQLEEQLKDVNERCSLLETRVAQLSLENRQLIRRLKKHFEDSGIDPSSSFATNFLITIPHTKLQKSKHTSGSYHLYEIHITMRHNLEHWSLLRRYSEFYKLHKSLLKTHPCVSSVEFPPKKRFGNMNSKFVEDRRQQLQIYLLNLVETLPQVEACKTKSELQKVFPFLREQFKL